MMPMIRMPISVPNMEPSPPDMDVPPMTTAAMASISWPSALVGTAESRREESSSAATPQHSPLNMYTKHLTFFRLMPESLAQFSLPPTA